MALIVKLQLFMCHDIAISAACRFYQDNLAAKPIPAAWDLFRAIPDERRNRKLSSILRFIATTSGGSGGAAVARKPAILSILNITLYTPKRPPESPNEVFFIIIGPW